MELTYILVVKGDVMYPGLWENGHMVVGGQVQLGGGGILVGYDAIGYRQKLLDLFPPSFFCRAPVVAEPDRQPGEVVSYHSTEPTGEGRYSSWVSQTGLVVFTFLRDVVLCSRTVFWL